VHEAVSWLDYLTAISTALAAIGTLGAVTLSLYLAVWQSRRRRPALSVVIYEETEFGAGWNPGERTDDAIWGIPLLIANARGKATAHQAEVLVALASCDKNVTDGWYDWVADQPLVWKLSKTPDGEGVRTLDIPAGASRKIFVAFIGEANVLFRTLWPRTPMPGLFADDEGHEIKYGPGGRPEPVSPPIAGVLATYPFTQEDPWWMWRDERYRVRLTLTCEEADAVTYEAFVTFSFERRQPGEPGSAAGQDFIQPRWSGFSAIR
jgi:hypothetical protein